MKVLKVEDEQGQYKDVQGNRFTLIYGEYAIGPRASEFDEFNTLEEALEYYKLVDINAPVVEEDVVISNKENTTEERDEVE